MDFKIIKLNETVCLHRNRDENGNETVVITAFIFNPDDSDYQVEERVTMPSERMVRSFIQDFSDESAQEWLDAQIEEHGIEPKTEVSRS